MQSPRIPAPSAADASSLYRGTRGQWEEALNLCSRIVPFLHSRSWDTRDAAAQAIESICRGAGIWDPQPVAEDEKLPSSSLSSYRTDNQIKGEDTDDHPLEPLSQHDLLSFDDFSIEKILTQGTKLLSSTGKEYDILAAGGSVADHLAQAKADMARMGLGGLGGVEMDIGLDVEAELADAAQGQAKSMQSERSNPTGSPELPPPRFAPQPAGTFAAQIRAPGRVSGSPTGSRSKDVKSAPSSPTSSQVSKFSNGNGVKPTSSSAITATSDAGASATPDDEVDMSKLSARERNQLKRKRKLEGKTAGANGVSKDEKVRIIEATQASSTVDTLSAATGLRLKTASNSHTPGTPAGERGPHDYLEAGSKVKNPDSPSQRSTPIVGSPVPSSNGGDAAKSKNAQTSQTALSLIAPPGEWPFYHLASLLLLDLFSPRWEVRHGACLALRSIFSVQGAGAGKSLLATSNSANEERKARWTEDAAVKLLCLLCLDRLSDFVFDQVVAPVREVAAQALSALLPHLSIESTVRVRDVLIAMTEQRVSDASSIDGHTRLGRRGDPGYAWEVRHAGLSGLRWLIELDSVGHQRTLSKVEVKQEEGVASTTASSVEGMLQVAHVALQCLRDGDDDVRAVASAVLLPLASRRLVEELSSILPQLLDTLWICLSDLKDDLNSSTANVMDLLARLLGHESVSRSLEHSTQTSLRDLIPLIYPFFRHTITSVRLSVLNTLEVFLKTPSASSSDWIDARLFRLLYQNLIVEEKLHIREASAKVWTTALQVVSKVPDHLQQILSPHFDRFTQILMTPLGTPFDYSLFFSAAAHSINDEGRYNVDKSILAQDLSLVGVDTVIKGRLGALKALGDAIAHLQSSSSTELLAFLDSPSALQQCLAAYLIQEWALAAQKIGQQGLASHNPAAQELSRKLLNIVESPSPPTWSEMGVQLSRIQMECQALLRAFQAEGKVAKAKIPILPVAIDPLGQRTDAFSSDTAERVVTKEFDILASAVAPKVRKAALPVLEDRRRKIIASIGFFKEAKDRQDTQVLAAVSAAIISLRTLPPKLNPIIRSIMNSVKFEENIDLQQRSARAVTELVASCKSPGAKADPSPKIVKNLCAFVCQDTTRTSVFASVRDTKLGILTLNEVPPPPSARNRTPTVKAPDVAESEATRQGRLIRRGAEMALQEMATAFGADLFHIVPALWDGMTATLVSVFGDGVARADEILDTAETGVEKGQGVLDCCTLIETVSCQLAPSHQSSLGSLWPHLLAALQSKYAAVRSAAARCLSELADSMTQPTMLFVVQHALPLLGDATSTMNRQGVIELLSNLVSRLDIKILPYVIVLVVPVLGRMSDADEQVRLMATSTFASLIKMVPLEAGLQDPPGFPEELMQRRENERRFLSQLLDGHKVEPYDLPVKINAELRKYQKEGVSWMNFLAKFQLHGVLCDDMGLGKTMQSICILSANHHERAERYKSSNSRDAIPLPSLVVCPPTLTGHWVHEIGQFANNLRPLLYSGSPTERASLQKQIQHHDVVVLSYDVVRNDVGYLSSLDWNYCILDEGHIIKSAKTKTTKAVKMIKANHRLILTGTPIQNNVLELWSLFDFLMPGFLGSERAFHERFGKPLLATREGKASSKEHEAAALALESLHKQVLPFLLRRLKDDVLDDLPPKIIQDIECELGEIQKKLYDEYSSSQAMGEVDEALEGGGDASSVAAAPEKQHVFQTLQYLRKLVNHPALVYNTSRPTHKAIIDQHLAKTGSKLEDISHAPKLQSLMQLLQSCGIGGASSSAETDLASGVEAVSSQHRVLVFCQMKQMLDIIENDLFKVHMSSVSYMRLDGSVPSDKRHGIVQTFNSDPSIDVLLLTTQVGGLGLTLTGADTVVFVEHDWNPMKDLQAMDRAHRLGQKKVVNVYRLITKNTLEARIMGLQQFKLNVANTVVSQQNNLDSMQTDQVLDLFSASASGGGDAKDKNPKGLLEAAIAAGGGNKKVSQKALLDSAAASADTGEDYARMGEWRPPGQ